MSCSKAYLSFLVEYEEALRENQSAQSMPFILLKDLPKSFHVVLLEGGSYWTRRPRRVPFFTT